MLGRVGRLGAPRRTRTLDKVRAAGVLRVGTEGTYSPFTYHDPTNNQLTGYDVEVITAVAAKMGLRTEFVEAPFDSIFASLQSDRFDLVANQVTKNAQREATYALSAPYTVSDGVIVTRTDDSSITSLADLKGKTTAQSSTSNWAQVAKDAGAKVEAVEGFTQAVTLVKQKRVDATVNDNLAVAEYSKTTGDTTVKIAAKTGDTSEQVFAMRQAGHEPARRGEHRARPGPRGRPAHPDLGEVLRPGRQPGRGLAGAAG